MDRKARLERLKLLTSELEAAGNARPYDPDAYNRIVDDLNSLMQTELELEDDQAIEENLDPEGE